MAKEVKLKVKLLSYTKQPQKTVTAAIRQCYSSAGADQLLKNTSKDKQKKLISLVTSSGHTSTIEHASFTFAIEGISRACSHQLVRHRIASFSQQSQRYVDLSKKEMTYIIPPEISYSDKKRKEFGQAMEEVEAVYKKLVKVGIKPEDARFVLPNACETKLVLTMNARSLTNFFRLRTCRRAQWEIRALAKEMMRLVKKTAPLLFANVGPSCQTEKICWEGEMSCGLYKKIPGAKLKSRK
ncbi:MAG: FAD-dependent thymidylate synthase [Patescibacteria group bacterium]|jgi:thymidylate synthase (FAD)